PPVRVSRRSAARFTATVPSGKRARTSRPSVTGAAYRTRSRSPGCRVGRIESCRTRAMPNVGGRSGYEPGAGGLGTRGSVPGETETPPVTLHLHREDHHVREAVRSDGR